MKIFFLALSFLILPFAGAQVAGDCDMKGLEEKAFEDIGKYLKFVQKDKKKKDKMTVMECEKIVEQYEWKYSELAVHVYREYRDYLNDFLTEAAADERDVKQFKKLTDFLRRGDMEKLIKKHHEAHVQQEKASRDSSKNYQKYNDRYWKVRKELEVDLFSRYKALRMNMAEMDRKERAEEEKKTPPPKKDPNRGQLYEEVHPWVSKRPDFLPKTNHDCHPWDVQEQDPQKVLDSLVDFEPEVNLANPCSFHHYDYNKHPSMQKVLKFQLQDGRAMVWFCGQTFTHKDPMNFKTVESKAGCLAWDLLNNRPMLGDQKQEHVSYEGPERGLTVADKRLELAKAKGKVPLSYEEFIKKNQKLMPSTPKDFFAKVPKDCHFWHYYRDALKRAESAVLKAQESRRVEY